MQLIKQLAQVDKQNLSSAFYFSYHSEKKAYNTELRKSKLKSFR